MEEKKDAVSLFRDCVRTFTTQPLDIFFYKDEQGQSLLVQSEGVWVWNDRHSFWTKHREAAWAFREIGDIFLHEYAIYQQRPYDETAFVKKVRMNAAKQLEDLFQVLTCGMDLDLLTALSNERYESAAGTGLRMALISHPTDLMKVEDLLLFEEDHWIKLTYQNTHALRKYLNMAQSACLAVCYTHKSTDNGPVIGDFYAVGLLSEDVRKKFPCISFPGHMEWQFYLPPALAGNSGSDHDEIDPGCRVRCMQGRLFLPLLNPTDYEHREIQNALDAYPVQAKGMLSGGKEKVFELVQQVKKQKKGALLIIADEAVLSMETVRLCRKKHCGIALNREKKCKSISNLVVQLSAIDGAVLADWNGDCWACGVILDGNAAEGDMSRGSRYNSARSYLVQTQERFSDHPPLGIVVSEDGMVNFLNGMILSSL